MAGIAWVSQLFIRMSHPRTLLRGVRLSTRMKIYVMYHWVILVFHYMRWSVKWQTGYGTLRESNAAMPCPTKVGCSKLMFGNLVAKSINQSPRGGVASEVLLTNVAKSARMHSFCCPSAWLAFFCPAGALWKFLRRSTLVLSVSQPMTRKRGIYLATSLSFDRAIWNG